MTILRILDYPDPKLKRVAISVDDINDPRAQQMITDMLETLEHTPHCGGLASTQLSTVDPFRIFVFYDFIGGVSHEQIATVAVNPEIISTEGEVKEAEGCMSVYPDFIHLAVRRPKTTTMRCLDQTGKVVELTRSGYLAKNFVHEVDHLNGLVFIDHLKPLKRTMVDKKIIKVQRIIEKERNE